MTGYGRGSAEAESVRVTVEARSVNHRFADLRLRIPSELAEREADLKRSILARVQRGRVDIDIRLEHLASGTPRVVLNRPLVEGAIEAARVLHDDYGLSGTFDRAEILSLPGMLQAPTDAPSLDERGLAAVHEALDAAVAAMDAERVREGEALRKGLVACLDTMESLLGKILAIAPEVPKALQKKLKERLAALAGDVEIDPWRLAQEAAVLADRADVSEELQRLEAHVGHARNLLASTDGSPVGKRLDFLLQEINREANTLNSKCSDLSVGGHALGIRAECEKLREQIQNLE